MAELQPALVGLLGSSRACSQDLNCSIPQQLPLARLRRRSVRSSRTMVIFWGVQERGLREESQGAAEAADQGTERALPVAQSSRRPPCSRSEIVGIGANLAEQVLLDRGRVQALQPDHILDRSRKDWAVS